MAADIKTTSVPFMTIDPIAAGQPTALPAAQEVDDAWLKQLGQWDVGFGSQSLHSNTSLLTNALCSKACVPDCKWHKTY